MPEEYSEFRLVLETNLVVLAMLLLKITADQAHTLFAKKPQCVEILLRTASVRMLEETGARVVIKSLTYTVTEDNTAPMAYFILRLVGPREEFAKIIGDEIFNRHYYQPSKNNHDN